MRRRDFLASGLAMVMAAPGWAKAAEADRALQTLLERHFERQLDLHPERATELGLDTGARASQRQQLTSRSPRAIARRAAQAAADLADLKRIDRSKLSPGGKLDYDVALFRYEGIAERLGGFPYHTEGASRIGPYGVSQTGGAYGFVPSFLENQHPLSSPADADAYLARLSAFPGIIDGETEWLAANAARGVVPPDFVIDGALTALRRLLGTPAKDAAVVRAFARRSAEAGLKVDADAAARLVDGPVRAALARQVGQLELLQRRSTADPGVGRLPNGEAYYGALLRLHTTTSMSADAIHRIGLEQAANLTAQMDGLLRANGYTKGTIGERLDALKKDPEYLWPNTDAGRGALLQSLRDRMAELHHRLPQAFGILPKTPLEVRRLPPAMEGGASPGGYQPAPIDGSRPGAFYVNLKDMGDWPRWFAPSFGYHEGNPGHHFQNAVAREAGDVPLYRRTQNFTAFAEGWGLYAERVADELGVYEAEPILRLGYLQGYLFRALRLVVDTGLHAKGWSRERAVAYLLDGGGLTDAATVREVDRYCIQPGQACAYKIGETAISGMRGRAEQKLGHRFDIRRFHDAVLQNGALPLQVLERVVDEWIARTK